MCAGKSGLVDWRQSARRRFDLRLCCNDSRCFDLRLCFVDRRRVQRCPGFLSGTSRSGLRSYGHCLNDCERCTFRDLVTDFDQHGLDATGNDCRHIHRCLVRFQRDQRVFDLNLITFGYKNFNDLDVFKVTQVGNDQRLYTTGPLRLACGLGRNCKNRRVSGWLVLERRGDDYRIGHQDR